MSEQGSDDDERLESGTGAANPTASQHDKAGPVKLTYTAALGFAPSNDAHCGMAHLTDGVLVYKVGLHLAVFHYEGGQFRFLMKQPSSADIRCYAVCPNRRYIALSEVHVPEKSNGSAGVSIWSIDPQTDNPNEPLHTKKVRSFSFSYLSKQPAVAMGFSSDNRTLVTATAQPDSFLFLWQLDKSCKLIAMCELTSKVTMCSISPYSGTTICTTGPSSVRLWRYTAPNQLKPLDPLNKRGDYTFTCHCWLDDDKVLVTTAEGDVLIIENFELKKTFPAVHPEGNAVNTAAVMSRGFLCAGDGGYVSLFECTYDGTLYNKYKVLHIPNVISILHLAVSPNEETVTLACEGNIALCLSLTNIDIAEPGRQILAQSSDGGKEDGESIVTALNVGFHSDLVTAVAVCVQRTIVVTGSLDGKVLIYNYVKKKTEINHSFDEEVLAVDCHPSGHRLMIAFKYKMAMYVVLTRELYPIQEFPVKSCKEIVFSKGGQYFAASVVTKIFLYNSYNFNCVGFLSAHTSMVRSLQWVNSDRNIVSGGYEGAIYVWDVVTCKKIDRHDCITKATAHSSVQFDSEMQLAIAVGSNKISDHGLSEGTVAARVFSLGHDGSRATQEVRPDPSPGGGDDTHGPSDHDVLAHPMGNSDTDPHHASDENQAGDAHHTKDDDANDDHDAATADYDARTTSAEHEGANTTNAGQDGSPDALDETDHAAHTKGDPAGDTLGYSEDKASPKGAGARDAAKETGSASAMILHRPIVLGSIQERQGHTRTHTREVAISTAHRCVFVGATNGHILVYAWPLREPAQLLSVVEAHQSTVSFLVLSPDESYLISVGEDRSLFALEVTSIYRPAEKTRRPAYNHPVYDDVVYVLKQDLDAQFARIKELSLSNDELEASQAQELSSMRQNLEVLVGQKRSQTSQQVEAYYQRAAGARNERDDSLSQASNKQAYHEKLHLKAADDLEVLYTSKTTALESAYKDLKDQREDLIVLYEDKLYQLRKEWSKEKESLRLEQQELEASRKKDMNAFVKERDNLRKKGEEKLQLLESEYEEDLRQIKDQYQSEKRAKDAVCEKELMEWSLGQRKQEKNAIELERLQKEMKTWDDSLTRAKLKNKEHEKANEALRLEIDVRIDTITASEKKIFDLRKQTAELEKLRCVLVFKFNELRKEVSPKEAQIRLMEGRTQEMQQELERVTQDTDSLSRALATKEEKIQVVQREITAAKRQIEAKDIMSRSLLRQLHSIATTTDQRRLIYSLRDTIEAHSRCGGDSTAQALSSKGKILHEFHRQRAHIEKQLSSMATQTQRRENNLAQDNRRKTAENALLVREINALRYEKKSVVENLNHVEAHIRELLMKNERLKPPGHIEGATADNRIPAAEVQTAASTKIRRPSTATPVPRATLMDKVRIDSMHVAEVVQQVERNNSEMARQQADIQRLREFVAHLLSCAQLDEDPTDEQLDVCHRIRSEVIGSNTNMSANSGGSVSV